MNLAIALTAARYGAATANYAEVLRLLKTTDPGSGKERVCGARCRDVLTGVCLARCWRRRGTKGGAVPGGVPRGSAGAAHPWCCAAGEHDGALQQTLLCFS